MQVDTLNKRISAEIKLLMLAPVVVYESFQHSQGPLGLVHGHRVPCVVDQDHLEVAVAFDVSSQLLVNGFLVS
jgi:hypothetical protein